MAELTLTTFLTLDGMFEGPKNWDLDWHQCVWGPELEQLLEARPLSTGCVILRYQPERPTP